MGKYNGFGGKVEVGETIEQAAIREVNALAVGAPDSVACLIVFQTKWVGLPRFFSLMKFFVGSSSSRKKPVSMPRPWTNDVS